MKYLNIIKYQNLIWIALIQIIIRYGFLMQQDVWHSLNTIQFALLVLATVCIAAGYNVIEGVFSEENILHKKNISENNAYMLYAVLSIAGVSIGMYLSNIIQKPGFIALFIFIVALGYFNATTLKEIFIIKLVIKPLLLSFSIIIIAFFDIFPATYDGNRRVMTLLFSILKDYALFVFIIQFIREMLKENITFINKSEYQLVTIASKIGLKGVNYILSILLFFPSIYLIYYSIIYLLDNNLFLSILYLSLFVIAPLLFFGLKIITTTSEKEYLKISKYSKYILILGILSIAVITYNIQQNV